MQFLMSITCYLSDKTAVIADKSQFFLNVILNFFERSSHIGLWPIMVNDTQQCTKKNYHRGTHHLTSITILILCYATVLHSCYSITFQTKQNNKNASLDQHFKLTPKFCHEKLNNIKCKPWLCKSGCCKNKYHLEDTIVFKVQTVCWLSQCPFTRTGVSESHVLFVGGRLPWRTRRLARRCGGRRH